MKTRSTKAGSSSSKSKTTQTSKSTSSAAPARSAPAEDPDEIAERIERVKLDLLSLISHELRTPLSSVLNALTVLREESLPSPERLKFLDMALRNADRLNRSLGQLLDLSKLVSGRLVCRFHEVSLGALFTSQLDWLRAEAALLGTNLHVEGEPDGLPSILGDAPRLTQVLHSLFENALKFSAPRSPVEVSVRLVREHGQSVRVVVTNTTKPDQPIAVGNLTAIFAQQEGVLSRKHEGIGGSLAIAAEVARQHGGSFSIEVPKHPGAAFVATLTLPILENEEALMKVLESRMFALRSEVGALSLLVIEVPPKQMAATAEALKTALFRASDSVYTLTSTHRLAVLMDDCKKSDAPKIVRRLVENIGPERARLLRSARAGIASCPEDGMDPTDLFEVAVERLIEIDRLVP